MISKEKRGEQIIKPKYIIHIKYAKGISQGPKIAILFGKKKKVP